MCSERSKSYSCKLYLKSSIYLGSRANKIREWRLDNMCNELGDSEDPKENKSPLDYILKLISHRTQKRVKKKSPMRPLFLYFALPNVYLHIIIQTSR